MHLLSKKQTALYGVLISLASVFVIYDVMHSVIGQSPLSMVVAVILAFVYVKMWIQYVRAYRMRNYDRRYAKAKDAFYDSLNLILPSAGKRVIAHEMTSIHVYRDSLRFYGEYFSILVVQEADMFYDEETMTHTMLIPNHFYHVNKQTLFIHKSFDMTVVEVVRSEVSDEISVNAKLKKAVSARALHSMMRKTPADLLYASIEEVNELSAMLISEENGTVF